MHQGDKHVSAPKPGGLKLWRPNGRIPDTYLSLVERTAVLSPLMGKIQDVQADVPALAASLSARWRSRVNELCEHNVLMQMTRKESTRRADDERVLTPDQRQERQKWLMLNCKPAFYMSKEQGWYCRNPALCPYCWARDASALWQRIDARLFALNNAVRIELGRTADGINARGLDLGGGDEDLLPPKLNGTTALLVRIPVIVSRTVQRGGTTFNMLQCALQQRTKVRAARATSPGTVRGRYVDHTKFMQEGCFGGLESIGLRSQASEDVEGDFAWQVTLKQLLFVPSEKTSTFAGLVKGVMPATLRDKISVRLHKEPSRRLVALLVAQIMQYDKLFLFGEPEQALAALQARWRCRLTTTFGYLYGRNS